MVVWVFYKACDRHHRVSCNVQPQMKQCHDNKSSVEFQNKADDTDAKACALRWEVMSPWPAKTVSVQIQLDVWRLDTFNYPKIPPKMLPQLDIYKDKWSSDKGALHWEGVDQLGSLVGFLRKCACLWNDDITLSGMTNNWAREKTSSTDCNGMGGVFLH